MEIIKLNKDAKDLTDSVVTVGNFDGFHTGHQHLIEELITISRKTERVSVIVTFEPHTRLFFHPDSGLPLLTTFEEKIRLIKEFGVDYIVKLNFKNDVAGMDAEEFAVEVLKKKISLSHLLMGENNSIGKNKKGSLRLLRECGAINHFTVSRFSLKKAGGVAVSSTMIRNYLNEHSIRAAIEMLGHPYPIMAKRISGVKKGTELGYPTLNFSLPPSQKFVPPPGIYAAKVEYDDCVLNGVLYFGNCPTFSNRDYHFEFHSIDKIEREPGSDGSAMLWVCEYIRKDAHFDTEEDLKAHIKIDIDKIKKFFSKEKDYYVSYKRA